jgi:hypothetical protein
MATQSEGQGQLAAALARAQGAFAPIRKNRTVEVVTKDKSTGKPNGSYTFRYATLDAVLDATRSALAENELSLSTTINAGVLTVTLTHSSGEWRSSALSVPDPTKSGWKEFGSATTYGTRYLVSPLLGVASENDDDGNAADGDDVKGMETQVDPWVKLWDDLAAAGKDNAALARAWVEQVLQRSVQSMNDLTAADFPALRDTLDGKRPLPPARVMSTKEQLADLNKAIDALAPWGTTDKAGEELAALKKAAKRAWINKMLEPRPAKPIEASAELTQEQVLALTKRALAGEV